MSTVNIPRLDLNDYVKGSAADRKKFSDDLGKAAGRSAAPATTTGTAASGATTRPAATTAKAAATTAPTKTGTTAEA